MSDDPHFHTHQPDAPATPLVVWVEWAHRPDDTFGKVCVECQQPWPCAAFDNVRRLVVAVLNVPHEDLQQLIGERMGLLRQAQEATRRRDESRGLPKRPIDLASRKPRKR